MGEILAIFALAFIAIFGIFIILAIPMGAASSVAASEQKAIEEAVEILYQASKYCIDNHSYQLKLEKERYTRTDQYGLIFDCGWSYSGNNQIGIGYFVNTVVRRAFDTRSRTFRIEDAISKFHLLRKGSYFEWIEKEIDLKIRQEFNTSSIGSRLTVEEVIDVERMSGTEYEQYCKSILCAAGWVAYETPFTGDQGVDLIAKNDQAIVCIQCKRYSNPVGNRAVQEVIAGREYYGGTHAAVVSNAEFTTHARELAASTNVILISHTELENLKAMV